MLKACMIGCSLTLVTLASAYADGDAANGEKIFKRCAACHVLDDKTKSGRSASRRRGRPHRGYRRGLQVFRRHD